MWSTVHDLIIFFFFSCLAKKKNALDEQGQRRDGAQVPRGRQARPREVQRRGCSFGLPVLAAGQDVLRR